MRLNARRIAIVVTAAAVACTSAVLPVGRSATADVNLVSRFRTEVGPLGPITVIGDSVLLGSAYFAPTLDDRLIEQGWGPVRIRAGVGNSTGKFTNRVELTAPYWINRWRAEGWDPVDIVVNLGANDAGTCAGNVQCAYEAIMFVVDAVGPGHRIWWPKITTYPYLIHHQNGWNAALDRVATERDDFFTWDWPKVMYAENLYVSDYIHLTVPGYRRRSQLMAHEITADLGRARQVATDVALPTPSSAPSGVLAIPPSRVLDTRDGGRRVDGGTWITVDLSDEVPVGTTAAAVYVSAAQTAGPGYLTTFDCSGPPPTTSVVNYGAQGARGAVAITELDADMKFCLFTLTDAHLIVDVQAAFVPTAAGGKGFTPLTPPQRLADTRVTGRAQVLRVAMPPGTEIAAVTLTSIRGAAPGFLTAYPCTADIPVIATVNYGAGEVISGAAFVPTNSAGEICVYASSSTDVTVDLSGTFADDGDLVFVPAPPTRTIDTRYGTGGWAPLHGREQTIESQVAPTHARAVSGTIVLVNPMRNGHLRAYGCGPRPDTASVTAVAGVTLANSLTTGVSAGKLCVYSASAATTVFDTTGWWIPAS